MKNRIMGLVSRVAALTLLASSALMYMPANAADLTSMKDVMSRVKISTQSSHTISFQSALGIASTDTVTITFPAGFDLTGASTAQMDINGGTPTATFAIVGQAINISGFSAPIAAASTITIRTGITTADILNPGVAGSYLITVSDSVESGDFAVGITADDQVTVTATVDPSFTFNVGSSTVACDGTVAGNGGNVGLGTLSFSSVVSSDTARSPGPGNIEHICTRVSTNATGGYGVTVKSLYGALKSAATPADNIPVVPVTAAPSSVVTASGTPSYGLCFGTVALDSGVDTTTPAGNAPGAVAPYNATCTASTSIGLSLGELSTTTSSVMTGGGVAQNAFATLRIKALISAVTPAHNDYRDTLTFVATGTF